VILLKLSIHTGMSYELGPLLLNAGKFKKNLKPQNALTEIGQALFFII